MLKKEDVIENVRTFYFNGDEVRAIIEDGTIYLIARDVLKALRNRGYNNVLQVMHGVEPSDLFIRKIRRVDVPRFVSRSFIVSLNGLLKFFKQSYRDDKKGKEFWGWIVSDIIPAFSKSDKEDKGRGYTRSLFDPPPSRTSGISRDSIPVSSPVGQRDIPKTSLRAKSIRLSLAFWRHIRTIKLEGQLGASGIRSLIVLMCWCAENSLDGGLHDLGEGAIELIAEWKGSKGQLLSTLLETGWMSGTEGKYALQMWWED